MDKGSQYRQLKKNIRKHLWDSKNEKFIPHIYLNGSPFPADFDENKIYYHGGTAVAIEAGLLSKKEVRTAFHKMQENMKAANAATIGLTIYPVYPEGFLKNKVMGPYSYQNGGDWTWFGGRMVTQLIRYGLIKEACTALDPMLERVIKKQGILRMVYPFQSTKRIVQFSWRSRCALDCHYGIEKEKATVRVS